MADARSLIVGARGWDHAGWTGSFYPEDLPEDWRLSYYANEFSGVLVPESVWREAASKDIAIWIDDVTDGFLFFLEQQNPGASGEIALSFRNLFGPYWGGIPVNAGAVWSADEKWDLRRLREHFDSLKGQSRGATAPCFFLCGDPPDIDRMREAKLLADML